MNFDVVIDTEVQQVSGTSASSPTFASVIALINDELIAAGKSPLGFLNPWLYSTASDALNDITEGDNPGCGTDGFSATTGWDPVRVDVVSKECNLDKVCGCRSLDGGPRITQS